MQLEKDLLRRKLSQLKDDKVRYANKRCVEEMYREEPFRLFANGSIEQLDQINPQNLYAYYQEMLTNQPMRPLYCRGYRTKSGSTVDQQAF